MSIESTITGLVACIFIWIFGFIKEKRHQTGVVPIIPPFYIQFVAIVGVLVFAAHLFVLLTGIDWKPPFQR